MFQKLSYNFRSGVQAIWQNKFRGFLTSLGIIFGVASVIAMMAIGQGAQMEILEDLEVLGTNNIIIEPMVPEEEDISSAEGEATDEGRNKPKWSPGLRMSDAQSIREIIPFVTQVSPEIVYETTYMRNTLRRKGKLIGVSEGYFNLSGFKLESGQNFSKKHYDLSAPVCIIGHAVRARFFPGENPIGKRIKVGHQWLTVIGVAANRKISKSSRESLGIRDLDNDVYTPIRTMLLRFRNRAFISTSDLEAAIASDDGGFRAENYHQIDRLVVTVEDHERIGVIGEVIARMLHRRHNSVADVEVVIPEQLLKQRQETERTFFYVLISIAAISLLVGGIGIMNIMLASVMERIREIGVRLALGATKTDIAAQFLSEAVILSMAGGIFGILLGVGFSLGIESISGVRTEISMASILISFLVSFSVGVIFGYFPAAQASKQDPVVSLRHE